MKKQIIIILLALAALPVFAETIKDIRVINQEGESYDISSVLAFASLNVGQEVSDLEVISSAIATDVNRMRESGRYSYVKAHMEVEPDGVVLIYTVTAKHRLRRIEIKGADRMRNRKVLKKSELEIGQFADDTTFELAASKIKTAYADFWYPDTRVDWTATADDELGTVDVTYTIDEGRKLGIKKVEFEGNRYADDDRLKRLLEQKEKRWYSFITKSGQFKDETTDLDVFSLKSFYMNNGFLDVQVADPVLDDSDPRNSRLLYRIDEGQRYRIGEVSISGMESFSEEELMRTIRLRSGSFASYENIEEASEGLRAFFGNRGYIRVGVQPVFDADANTGVVDIDYAVSEGSIGYVNKINIRGNERTADKVIRRELVVYPGENTTAAGFWHRKTSCGICAILKS